MILIIYILEWVLTGNSFRGDKIHQDFNKEGPRQYCLELRGDEHPTVSDRGMLEFKAVVFHVQ